MNSTLKIEIFLKGKWIWLGGFESGGIYGCIDTLRLEFSGSLKANISCKELLSYGPIEFRFTSYRVDKFGELETSIEKNKFCVTIAEPRPDNKIYLVLEG